MHSAIAEVADPASTKQTHSGTQFFRIASPFSPGSVSFCGFHGRRTTPSIVCCPWGAISDREKTIAQLERQLEASPVRRSDLRVEDLEGWVEAQLSDLVLPAS
jgi:hypothetical protein